MHLDPLTPTINQGAIDQPRNEKGPNTPMITKRTDPQIDEQLTRAIDGIHHGTQFPDLSFEDGISAFCRWLQGCIDKPLPTPHPNA